MIEGRGVVIEGRGVVIEGRGVGCARRVGRAHQVLRFQIGLISDRVAVGKAHPAG
jgi:hypothetical protein